MAHGTPQRCTADVWMLWYMYLQVHCNTCDGKRNSGKACPWRLLLHIHDAVLNSTCLLTSGGGNKCCFHFQGETVIRVQRKWQRYEINARLGGSYKGRALSESRGRSKMALGGPWVIYGSRLRWSNKTLVQIIRPSHFPCRLGQESYYHTSPLYPCHLIHARLILEAWRWRLRICRHKSPIVTFHKTVLFRVIALRTTDFSCSIHIVAYLLKAEMWSQQRRPLLRNGSVAITWSPQQTQTQQWSNCGRRCFLRGPCRDVICRTTDWATSQRHPAI
jgi:hypothetical protein